MLKKLLLLNDMKTDLLTIFFTFIHSPHFFHIHTKHLEMIIVQRQVHPTSRILSSITNNTALMLASESVVLVSSTNAANVVTLTILVSDFFPHSYWRLETFGTMSVLGPICMLS